MVMSIRISRRMMCVYYGIYSVLACRKYPTSVNGFLLRWLEMAHEKDVIRQIRSYKANKEEKTGVMDNTMFT